MVELLPGRFAAPLLKKLKMQETPKKGKLCLSD